MRPIKFRGKSEEFDGWVHGDLSLFNYPNNEPMIYTDAESEWLVIPETVGEYTGLNDSKRTAEYPEGQPIYEGDILQINILDWNRAGNIIASGKAAVEYRGCMFGVEWGFSLEFSGLDEFSNNCTLEVIGNVFDNPDLLEVADAKTDGA